MARVAAASAEEAKASEAFLTAAAAEPGAEKLESGLVYREVSAGEGASPKASDTVKVHYHGTLRDGTVFDSSVQRGTPAEFPLDGVIPCWTEGVQKMKVGGKAIAGKKSEMPAMGKSLSDDEIKNLVAKVRSFCATGAKP